MNHTKQPEMQQFARHESQSADRHAKQLIEADGNAKSKQQETQMEMPQEMSQEMSQSNEMSQGKQQFMSQTLQQSKQSSLAKSQSRFRISQHWSGLARVSLVGALAMAAACGDTPTTLEPTSPLAARRTTTASTTTLSITNVNRTGYTVGSGLAKGATVYSDRNYLYDTVATAVTGATYLRTPNADKDVTPGSTSFLTFTVNQDVTVYVAHDIAVPVPAWLRSTSWSDAGASLIFFDPSKNQKTLHLYKRTFTAGTVTLGANADATAGGAMYTVALVPTGTTTTTPTTPSAPTVSITAPTSGATVSGTTTVTASASAAAGVAGVTFKIDGTTLGAEDTSAPYSVAWTTTSVANGTHTVTAIVRDSASQTATANVTVSVQNSTTTPTTHGGYYVSPTGSTSGDGSMSKPWTLASVLGGSTKVAAGDTVWMRGGTYSGNFTSYLTGTASAPIIVRQYPGERATIDGTLLVQGGYTWFWGFEVISTVVNPQDVMAVNINAPGTKAINMVVHDAGGNGFGMWDPAYDSEIYGSLIYNNGRQRLDGVYAHGIYGHSTPGHTAHILDNIVFDQFGYGLHMYTQQGSLSGFDIAGNTTFENGRSSSTRGFVEILVGGDNPSERVSVQDNMTYKTSQSGTNTQVGYFTTQNKDLVFRNNYIVGGQPALRMTYWSSATVSGNTINQIAPYEMVWLEGSTSGWSWTNNSYWRSATDGSAWYLSPNDYDLAGFKSVMRNTTDQSLGSTPTGTKVFVRPNKYEPGRANVTVYNWSNAGSVAVDMTGILSVGDAYEVRNVRDWFGTPAVKGTYGGGTISIPIVAVPAPVPLGGFVSSPPPSTTQFQTYVVKRVGT